MTKLTIKFFYSCPELKEIIIKLLLLKGYFRLSETNKKIIVLNFVNSVWPSGRFSSCLLISLSSINTPS